jgi:adenylylsulfate kinase
MDGDNVRHGLSSDLTFSSEDRTENIRRVGEVAKLFVEAGIIVLVAFISPFKKDRQFVHDLFDDGEFIEVYCNAPLDVCEGRDVKGLYKMARDGGLSEFTGISSPYEAPENPDLIVGYESVDHCVEQIVNRLIHQVRI